MWMIAAALAGVVVVVLSVAAWIVGRQQRALRGQGEGFGRCRVCARRNELSEGRCAECATKHRR